MKNPLGKPDRREEPGVRRRGERGRDRAPSLPARDSGQPPVRAGDRDAGYRAARIGRREHPPGTGAPAGRRRPRAEARHAVRGLVPGGPYRNVPVPRRGRPDLRHRRHRRRRGGTGPPGRDALPVRRYRREPGMLPVPPPMLRGGDPGAEASAPSAPKPSISPSTRKGRRSPPSPPTRRLSEPPASGGCCTGGAC